LSRGEDKVDALNDGEGTVDFAFLLGIMKSMKKNYIDKLVCKWHF